MYVKTFRYRVLPARSDEYLALRHQADLVYRRYFDQLPTYLQNTRDPHQWLEIYTYGDEASYKTILDQMQADPEIDRLWRRFRSVLDPQFHAAFDEFRCADGGGGSAPWAMAAPAVAAAAAAVVTPPPDEAIKLAEPVAVAPLLAEPHGPVAPLAPAVVDESRQVPAPIEPPMEFLPPEMASESEPAFDAENVLAEEPSLDFDEPGFDLPLAEEAAEVELSALELPADEVLPVNDEPAFDDDLSFDEVDPKAETIAVIEPQPIADEPKFAAFELPPEAQPVDEFSSTELPVAELPDDEFSFDPPAADELSLGELTVEGAIEEPLPPADQDDTSWLEPPPPPEQPWPNVEQLFIPQNITLPPLHDASREQSEPDHLAWDPENDPASEHRRQNGAAGGHHTGPGHESDPFSNSNGHHAAEHGDRQHDEPDFDFSDPDNDRN